jgi:glycosyltransferase involved in cell wall biosynthesis
MARPRTPRRAFDFVVATLAKVHNAMPDVEFVLFGEQIDSLDVPFPYRSAGVVTDPEQMARLYSSARVHFDGSDFQAFGLPALEAMACGTVSVLTDAGGVGEYARDGENCVLVAPGDVEGAAAAILRLLSDEPLVARLREEGFETSRGHSLQRQARATLRVLEEIARSAGAS